MLDYAFRYIYYQANIIEYIYVLLTVIIISNLAIIQMILTRRFILEFYSSRYTNICIGNKNNINSFKRIISNNL